MKTFKKIVISFVIALLSATLFGTLTFIILCLLIPLKDEQGHALMPLFQAFIGWVVAIVSFMTTGIVVFKKLKNKSFTFKISTQFIMILYAVVSLVFAFDVIISFYGYSFSGYYSDKILNWVWLAFTVCIIIRFRKVKFSKIYFFSLLGIIFLSLLPMAIPFFGMMYYFFTIDVYQPEIPFEADHRMELKRPLLAPKPVLFIYENQGIFEKLIATSQPGICKGMESMVEINPEKDQIHFVRLIKKNNDGITVAIQKNNQQEIVLRFPLIK